MVTGSTYFLSVQELPELIFCSLLSHMGLCGYVIQIYQIGSQGCRQAICFSLCVTVNAKQWYPTGQEISEVMNYLQIHWLPIAASVYIT